MRRTLGGIALLVAAALIGVVLGRSVAAPPTTQQIAHQAEHDAGLHRMVAEIDFRETALSDAIEALRAKTNANIVVRWDELEYAGVDRNMPITLRLKQLPLQRMLQMICELAGAGTELGAEEDRGVIIVSTKQSLWRESVLRLYDVRDLLEIDYELRFKHADDPTTRPGGASMMQYGTPYDYTINNLRAIIMDSIEPDTWRDAGGTIGSIHDFNGRLLITTTPTTHAKIADLLEKIRKG